MGDKVKKSGLSSLTPKLSRRWSKFSNSSMGVLVPRTINELESNDSFSSLGTWKSSEESFLEPFAVKKTLRKRKPNSFCEDTLSLNESFLTENPKKPRLKRMTSLAAFLSPAKQMKRVGGMLTRAKSSANLGDLTLEGSQTQSGSPVLRSPSFESVRNSFRLRKMDVSSSNDLSSSELMETAHQRQGSLRRKARASESMKRGRQWIEKFKENHRLKMMNDLSYWEIKRQEAMYELYKGEKYLVKDLEMVINAYRSSLVTLKILQTSEAENIFGPIDSLLPLHRELKAQLKAGLDPETKMMDSVGKVLMDWVVGLEVVYIPYLSNQVQAKDLLDSKKANCKELKNFLDLCLKSDFSRRLDLWNFLDVPRSKLMKYPLLLKSILKQTPEDHPDREYLPTVIERVENIIRSVDQKTGEANCHFVLKKLVFSEERQHEPFLNLAKSILCQGELKNNRGTKLYGFLFDTGFVLTRPIELDDRAVSYKVHKSPISAFNLCFRDLKDSEGRSGSFKSTFSYSNPVLNLFEVSSVDKKDTWVLSAINIHDKSEWLQRFKQVKEMALPAYSSPSLKAPATPRGSNLLKSNSKTPLHKKSTSRTAIKRRKSSFEGIASPDSKDQVV